MDEQNPAYARQTQINPVILEEIGNDPKVLNRYARKMRFLQMTQIHQRLQAPDAPLSLKIQFAEMLGKVDDAMAKQQAAAATNTGPGFSVNIILPPAQTAAPTPIPVITVDAKEPEQVEVQE